MKASRVVVVALPLLLVAAARPVRAQDGELDGGVPDAAPADGGTPDAPADGGAPDAMVQADGGVPDAAARAAASGDGGAASAAQDAGAPEPASEGDAPQDAPPQGQLEVPDDALEDESVYEFEDDVVTHETPMPDDESLYELPEVVVTHEREDLFRVGGSAHVIDEKTLETYENDDPHDVVTQVPGTYARGEDGFGLRPNIGLRGANSERSKKITLMEDGVLLAPAPYSAPAAYYFPVVTRMTGVEVFKGPAALMYGPHTVGGAINLLTRDIPDEPGGGLDVAAGMYKLGKLHSHYGWSNEHFGALIEGVHLQSGGFKELDGGGNTGFNKQELMLKLGANSDPEDHVFHRVQLKLGYSREHSNETYLGLTDEDFQDDPDRRYRASALDRLTWQRFQAQLSHRMQIGDDIDVLTTAYRHDFSRDWRKLDGFQDGPPLRDVLANPKSGRRQVYYQVLTGEADSTTDGQNLLVGPNDRSYVAQGVQTAGRLHLETGDIGHQVELGLRYHNDTVERDHRRDIYRMEGGELRLEEESALTTADNRAEAHAFAAHLLYGVSFAGLTVRPGLRTEIVRTEFSDRLADERQSNWQHVVLPGIGAHYAFTDEIGVLAGVYQGFSPVAPGQPDGIDPEKSINYELGGRYSTERTQLELIGFFNDYSNLVGQCRLSVGCTDDMLHREFNAGEVHVYGVEALAAHRFDLPRELQLPVRLAYTFTGSEFQTEFASANPQFGMVEKGDELPYVPRHQLALRFGVADAGEAWGAHASVTYVGKMRELAGRGDCKASGLRICGEPGNVTDDYVFVDLIGSYEVFTGGRLYLKLDNILGTRAILSRRPFGARPTRPFMAQAGFKYAL